MNNSMEHGGRWVVHPEFSYAEPPFVFAANQKTSKTTTNSMRLEVNDGHIVPTHMFMVIKVDINCSTNHRDQGLMEHHADPERIYILVAAEAFDLKPTPGHEDGMSFTITLNEQLILCSGLKFTDREESDPRLCKVIDNC